MARDDFFEAYKDPRWQRTRLAILERDNWHCARCGNGAAQLHVHHRYYESGKQPWDYEHDSLLTLCGPCHEEMGALRKAVVKAAAFVPPWWDERLLVIMEALRARAIGSRDTMVDVSNIERLFGLATLLGCSHDVIERFAAGQSTIDIRKLERELFQSSHPDDQTNDDDGVA